MQVTIYARILLLLGVTLLVATHAEANNDQAADVNSEGIVKSIHHTEPSSAPPVMEIAPGGISKPYIIGSSSVKPSFLPGPTIGKTDAHSYDATIRQSAKMPTDWFACKTPADCGLLHMPCNTSAAIGLIHKEEAQSAICLQIYPLLKGKCQDECRSSVPDTSLATCYDGQCITIIQSYGEIIAK